MLNMCKNAAIMKFCTDKIILLEANTHTHTQTQNIIVLELPLPIIWPSNHVYSAYMGICFIFFFSFCVATFFFIFILLFEERESITEWHSVLID